MSSWYRYLPLARVGLSEYSPTSCTTGTTVVEKLLLVPVLPLVGNKLRGAHVACGMVVDNTALRKLRLILRSTPEYVVLLIVLSSPMPDTVHEYYRTCARTVTATSSP
jgi:hypothetical protein